MIIAEDRGDDTIYNSSSPDEIALTNFAKFWGYEFKGMNEKNQMIVSIDNHEHYYTLHYTLDFTSKR